MSSSTLHDEVENNVNSLDVITCKVKYPPLDQLLSLDHVIPLLQECSSDDVSVCLKCAQLVSEWVCLKCNREVMV